MRRALVFCLTLTGCGSDFQVPARPDMRITLDLASSPAPAEDLGCFNTACGGCSSWAKADGDPVKVGDPCAWSGSWQCQGQSLVCSSAACPPCAGGTMIGSVCGADGRTVLQLSYPSGGGSCAVHDLGSAISTCNRTPTDHCVARCSQNGSTYTCTARCTSDDAGGTGCEHAPSETCATLSAC